MSCWPISNWNTLPTDLIKQLEQIYVLIYVYSFVNLITLVLLLYRHVRLSIHESALVNYHFYILLTLSGCACVKYLSPWNPLLVDIWVTLDISVSKIIKKYTSLYKELKCVCFILKKHLHWREFPAISEIFISRAISSWHYSLSY